MSDMWALPNPPGSPVEKIPYDVYLENIEPHLASILSENPTKEEILRAFTFYNESLLRYFSRYDTTFKYWANIHTHVSFGGALAPPGDFWAWYWWASDPAWEIENEDVLGTTGWPSTTGGDPFISSVAVYRQAVAALNNNAGVDTEGVTTSFTLRNTFPDAESALLSYPYTMVLVLNAQTLPSFGSTNIISTGRYQYLALRNEGGVSFWYVTTGFETKYLGSVSTGFPHLLILEMNPSGTSSKLWVNGDLVAEKDDSFTPPSGSLDWFLASSSSGSFPANLDFGFVGLVDTSLTAVQRQEILDWAVEFYSVEPSFY